MPVYLLAQLTYTNSCYDTLINSALKALRIFVAEISHTKFIKMEQKYKPVKKKNFGKDAESVSG